MTDDANRLTGIITDGDVRRALLGGENLQSPIDGVIERAPLTVTRSASRADVIDLMRSRDVSLVPVINGEGKVMGLHLLNEMIGREVLPNAALIMLVAAVPGSVNSRRRCQNHYSQWRAVPSSNGFCFTSSVKESERCT